MQIYILLIIFKFKLEKFLKSKFQMNRYGGKKDYFRCHDKEFEIIFERITKYFRFLLIFKNRAFLY